MVSSVVFFFFITILNLLYLFFTFSHCRNYSCNQLVAFSKSCMCFCWFHTHPNQVHSCAIYSATDLISVIQLIVKWTSALHTHTFSKSSLHFQMLSINTADIQTERHRVKSPLAFLSFLPCHSAGRRPLLITSSYCTVLDSELIIVFV